jgi:hypothetical protein
MAITFSKTWPNQLPEKLTLRINPRTSMSTRTVVLHTFTVGDVEDPMLYSTIPINEWSQSDKGQWCIENCEGELYLCSSADTVSFGYKIALQGEMSEQNYTFFKLKWPK